MLRKTKILLLHLIILGFTSIANASVCRDSYADIVGPLIPAVVNISTVQKTTSGQFSPFPENSPFEDFNRFFEQYGQMQDMEEDEENREDIKPVSAGSGFIISTEGHIVTNYHVVEQAETITVILSDDQKLDAKLIGYDNRTDLALLKVESKTPLPFVKFGNSDESRVGDFIIAIGNPFGLGSTVTSGIISAQARDIHTNSGNLIDNFIQTDAAINRGNSGGPMFNLKGEVIGINFAIVSPTGANIGIGFAVPSSAAKPVIEQLVKTGKMRYGWLGVAIQSTDDVAEGLGLADGVGSLVTSVANGSPAEKSGIQVGDIILKFDGKEITSSRKLSRIVAETPIGKKVEVEIMSKGKRKAINLTVSELDTKTETANITKNKNDKNIYGMNLTPLTPSIRSKINLQNEIKGVLVTSVERKTTAMRHGIKRGDIISAINQQIVNTPEELLNIIDEAKKNQRKSVMVLIYRDGGNLFLSMPITEKP